MSKPYTELPKTWKMGNPNPFEPDGQYGCSFSLLRIDPTLCNEYTISINMKNLFVLSVNPLKPIWKYRSIFFIQYESSYARRVLVDNVANIELSFISDMINEIDYKEHKKFDFEEDYLVHSTTTENWKSIQRSGYLKSLAVLKKEGHLIEGIGILPFNEPGDYKDYVMLDNMNGCGEIVVNSRNRNQISLNADEEYQPGARLYFSTAELVNCGLGVRDGIHPLKIKDQIELSALVEMTITADTVVNLNGRWTPRSFTAAANSYFMERMKRN